MILTEPGSAELPPRHSLWQQPSDLPAYGTKAGYLVVNEQDPPSEPLYAAMAADGVPYEPWHGLPLDAGQCFVCGRGLDLTSRTEEDVFPRWLQQDLRALPDRSRRPLLLPNATGIALNQVRIPACLECNGVRLSQLEGRISGAFRAGYSGVRSLSESDLRQWSSKIAYGCRFNDLRLDIDRRNPGSGKLATPDEMVGLSNLHWLLQEVRDVVRIAPGYSTFWTFEAPAIDCASCDWDVVLPIGWPNVVMFKHRGSVVLGAADDRGALSRLRDHPAFVAAANLALHKVQVRALVAILLAAANSMNSDAHPLRYGVRDSRVWIDRAPALADVNAYAGESESLASAILAGFIGVPPKQIDDMGGPTGYLVLPSGEPREMPVPAEC